MAGRDLFEKLHSQRLDRRTFVKMAGLLGGAAVLGLPLPACQQSAAPSKSFAVNAAEPSRMIVYGPYYVAQQKGYFEAEGVPTTWTEFAGGGEIPRAISGGTFHLGIGGFGAALAAYEAGEPIRMVASVLTGGGGAVIVRADSPYKKIEDLKGKKFKIGHSRPNSNTHILNMLSLKSMGVDPLDAEKVTLVASGNLNETWTAVKTGVLDMGWSSEPLITQVEKSGEGRVLFSYWDLLPDWIDGVILTTKDFADSNQNYLEAWLKGAAKGVEWTKGNRPEAAKILATYLGVPDDIAVEALKRMPDKAWPLAIEKKAIDFTYKQMVEFKLSKGQANLDEFIVRKALPSNLRNS